ncbi:transcription factor DIVARICATA-like [Prosopis cineraria]|uniref:transcription factor DIVARICATA-like n=1 Tax=Prosopis cineraria TaxID=364024 RepID=UPI002410A069|nr:transcription factor DIVARICATA-like [Prosopis cineraria]
MEPSRSHNSSFAPKSTLIRDSSSPLSIPEERSQVQWTWEENKVFENTLAEFGLESELLLPTLALRIPTKSINQFKEHLKALEDDIKMIECSDFDEIMNLGKIDEQAPKQSNARSIPRERRKGIPWTKTEHEMFLQGLERFGRGDWKSISRFLVTSKTPTQVASHAQKYFKKLENPKSRSRKDGSFMRTVDDSHMLAVAMAEKAQLAISDDYKKP